MSGIPLSAASIASGQSYETSGSVTPPGSALAVGWFGLATGSVPPAAGGLLVGNGSMAQELVAAGGSALFLSGPLHALGAPLASAGLDVTAAASGVPAGTMLSDTIVYRFLTATLPAGASLLLWETGTGLGDLTARFSIAADNAGTVVDTAHWSIESVPPFAVPSGASVTSGNGTVAITDPAPPISDPQTVLLVTPGVPITSVTVRAVTAASDTWGLAFSTNAVAQNDPPCFAAGTAIMTPGGPVPVERLAPGDAVVARFAGAARVVWTGRRRLAPRRHARPDAVWPYRILRDAIAPGVPARDLLLSPDHAVCLGGVLIPVKYLANGRSVLQDRNFETVEYWHVELARHDVLLAEALPVESYLDTGNRESFEQGGAALMLHPRFGPATWEADACMPLRGAGPPVDHVRAALLARAARLDDARRVTARDR